MTGQLKRIVISILLLPAAVAVAAAQGLYWESTMTGGSTAAVMSQNYYMPRMFKVVQKGEGENILLFRLDRERIYMLDPAEKTYQEMTFAEVEQQMKQMSAMMDQQMADLEKQMESMPPEQRKMLEQQMGGLLKPKASGSKPEIMKTGETKKVAGMAASKYVVRRDGKDVIAIWAAPEVKDWAGMRADFLQFAQRMGSLSRITEGMSDAYNRIDGFPVQTEIGGMTNTVTKVERKSTPPSAFDVPAGYKKAEQK
jgi:hypothetical protein